MSQGANEFGTYAFITPTAREITEARGGISKTAVSIARPHLPDDVSLERQEILCAGLAGDIDEAVKELVMTLDAILDDYGWSFSNTYVKGIEATLDKWRR